MVTASPDDRRFAEWVADRACSPLPEGDRTVDALVARARELGLPVDNVLHHKLDDDGHVLAGWRQYVANMTAWMIRWAR